MAELFLILKLFRLQSPKIVGYPNNKISNVLEKKIFCQLMITKL